MILQEEIEALMSVLDSPSTSTQTKIQTTVTQDIPINENETKEEQIEEIDEDKLTDYKLEYKIFTDYDALFETYIYISTEIKKNGFYYITYLKDKSAQDELMNFLINFILFREDKPDELRNYINTTYENSRFKDFLYLLTWFDWEDPLATMKMYISTAVVENDTKYLDDLKLWFEDKNKYENSVKFIKEIFDKYYKDGFLSLKAEDEVNSNKNLDSVAQDVISYSWDRSSLETIVELLSIKKQYTIWYLKDLGEDREKEIEEYYQYLDENFFTLLK